MVARIFREIGIGRVLQCVLTLVASAAIMALATPADAACNITGAGTQTSLDTGDVITCLGAGNTVVQTNNGESNITINIGDGTTATTIVDVAGVGIDSSTNTTIRIFNQAAIQGTNYGIAVNNASFNTVTIDAGATLATSNNGSSALDLLFSDSNTVTIGGQLGDLTAGTYAILAGGTSTGNSITILSTGLLQTSDQSAIRFNAGGNTITNSGTISSSTGLAIQASSGVDTIINSGTISGHFGANDLAILFSNGDDILELRAGSVITGNADAGSDADTLRFGGGTNASFDLASLGNANQYRNFEELEKTGSSTWTLTGTTTEAYSMEVSAGTLAVNGSMVNIDTVVSGGTLGGTGTVGDVTANSGGTVGPGNSIGTLNVDGNATFNAGSTLAVEVDDAGNSDLLEVTGTVVINGGTVAVTIAPGSYSPLQDYTIIHSLGGVTGTFSNVTWSGYNPAFFNASLDYGSASNNYVFLVLEYNDAAFLDLAQTPNQKAVAGVMGALGGSAPFISDFVTLTDDQVLLGLDTLSGEVHASLKGTIGTSPSLFQSVVRNRLANAFDTNGRDKLATAATIAPPAYALGAPGSGSASMKDDVLIEPAVSRFAWLSGAGSWGSIESDGNAAAVDTDTHGIFGGIDIPVQPNARLGIAAGWSRTNADVDARASNASADAWHIAGTGAISFSKFRIRGVLAYADYDIDTRRTAIIGTDTYTASAGYGGQRLEGLIEAGYVVKSGGALFEPYAGVGASWLHLDAFTETGGGDANLTSGSDSEDTPFTVLGLRYTTLWRAGGMMLTPNIDLAWRHLLDGGDPQSTLAFATATGTPWTIAGAPVGANAAVISAGVGATLSELLTLNFLYRGEVSGEADAHAVEGGLNLKF